MGPLPKSSSSKKDRTVSTLSPTQLARKRAHDRQAQRALRTRTKTLIENLQHDIENLKQKNESLEKRLCSQERWLCTSCAQQDCQHPVEPATPETDTPNHAAYPCSNAFVPILALAGQPSLCIPNQCITSFAPPQHFSPANHPVLPNDWDEVRCRQLGGGGVGGGGGGGQLYQPYEESLLEPASNYVSERTLGLGWHPQ